MFFPNLVADFRGTIHDAISDCWIELLATHRGFSGRLGVGNNCWINVDCIYAHISIVDRTKVNVNPSRDNADSKMFNDLENHGLDFETASSPVAIRFLGQCLDC